MLLENSFSQNYKMKFVFSAVAGKNKK